MENNFSQNLRLLRKKASLTQKEMSAQIGIRRPAYGAYEEGRSEPCMDTLIKIADYYDITIDDLIR